MNETLNETLIVDSWPVMEWLRMRDPAHKLFSALLNEADQGKVQLCMSRINRGEVWYQIAKRWGVEVSAQYEAAVATLPIEVLSIDDALVDEAARLKAQFAMSYADCFACALAIRMQAPVLTGDPDFFQIERTGLISVRWMGA